MPNPNHPPKNSVIRVEPIRDLKAIKNIKKLLADKPRDLAIFVIGTNTNLRSSCLTALTVKMVKNIEPGGHFTIREKKTGKTRTITVNKVVHEVIYGVMVLFLLGANRLTMALSLCFEAVVDTLTIQALVVFSVNCLAKNIHVEKNQPKFGVFRSWGGAIQWQRYRQFFHPAFFSFSRSSEPAG